jgi:hypothetical protein
MQAFGAFAIVAVIIGGVFYLSALSTPEPLNYYRQRLIFDFAASKDFVTFPVALAGNTSGLIFIDRSAGKQSVIYDDRVVMHSPFLSRDGKRLLFVQRKTPKQDKELISCEISNWQCDILLKTTAAVFSPVEVAPDTIIYSSSPLTIHDKRARAVDYDVYLLKTGHAPVRLTSFDAYALGSISIAGHRMLFKGIGHFHTGPLPVPEPLAAASSTIFSVELTDDYRIVLPKGQLKPLFVIDGDSSNPSIAPDGQHVAFLNRRNTQGNTTHFNMAVANASGKIIRYIKTEEFGFSRPQFVNHSIIANELHEKSYEVKEFALSMKSERLLFRIDNSVDALKKLRRIMPSYASRKRN